MIIVNNINTSCYLFIFTNLSNYNNVTLNRKLPGKVLHFTDGI